ncbi:hypothetical protein JTE90_017811 [Oedothorax gibbosus]|uniref:Uncharacterized protein n=1 Tax=Oedothorax gibbosus TaxID=931172 RepID=A0AAV6U6J7_9ARAC|nr:hypothetical protein JTE90_017811 [Oedothorax gibbosus]
MENWTLTSSLHPLPNSNQQPIDAHLQSLPPSPEPHVNDHPSLATPSTSYDSNAMETQEWTQPRNALKRKIQESPASNTFSHPTKYQILNPNEKLTPRLPGSVLRPH